MYCLSKFCYLCLRDKKDLKNINYSVNSSIKETFYRVIDGFAFDLNCLKKKRNVFMCSECCLILPEIYQFLEICHKNSRILQDYVSLLDNSMNSNQNYVAILCYVCLNETNNLEDNHSNQRSLNEKFLGIINNFAINLNWLKSKRYIRICNDCCLTLKEVFQFLEICYKKSKVFQGYIHRLESHKKNVETNLSVNLVDIVNTNYENSQEDETTVLQRITEESADTVADYSHSQIVIQCETKEMKNAEDKLELCLTIKSASQKFTSKKSLKLQQERPYKCSVCNNCFKTKSHLDTHMRIHTGEKPYKCETCNKCFSEIANLIRHIRIHTGEKPFECSICGRSFANKLNLDMHMRTHTGEKPYKCATCDKGFAQKSALNRHNRTHSGEKPYPCTRCSKCFGMKVNLNKHMRTHTGEKPHKCPVCLKCFAEASNLTKHMRTHSTDKPYKCPTCNKGFSVKIALERHMRRHTGEKPYKCLTCDKRYTQKSTLDVHMRSHTSDASKTVE